MSALPPMLHPRGAILLVLVLGTSLLATAHVAHAQGGRPGFSIAAAGFDSYFRFRAEPGDTVRGRLRLVSQSRRTVVVRLQPADVTTAAAGGLQYGEGRPAADGRWLRLARRTVRLAPGGGTEVPFTLRVGAGAVPGHHLASIVAVNRQDVRAARRSGRRGFAVRFLPRLAIAAQITVPGPAARELRVGGAGIEVTPSRTNATVLVRNTGDRLITGTTGRIELVQDDRVLVRRRINLDTFVPGTEVTLRVPFEGTPARGAYRVRGELRPKGAPAARFDEEVRFGDRAAQELRDETGIEAKGGGIGTLVVILVAGAATLLGGAAALIGRRRTGSASRHARRAVDLNAASPTELERLPGIGPAAARRIVAHRDEHGDFESVDELAGVDGLDETRVARVRELVRV
jgi:competence ComEA-like helix-hairpin-helix protein